MPIKRLWTTTMAALLGALVMGGCSNFKMHSEWRGSRAVLIDGSLTEWGERDYSLQEKQVLVGVMNDDHYFYLGLSSGDEATQRQVMRGFTIWFDPANGTRKVFGLRFPLDTHPQRPEAEAGLPERDAPDLDQMVHRLQGSTAEMEIVDATGEIHRVLVDEAGDMEVAINLAGGVLSYELRIPLGDDGETPFALGVVPGTDMGIGFETSQRKSRGGIGGMGGKKGGFGGGLGRSGLAPGGFGVNMREPFRFWTSLHLAEDPALGREN